MNIDVNNFTAPRARCCVAVLGSVRVFQKLNRTETKILILSRRCDPPVGHAILLEETIEKHFLLPFF